MRFFFLLGDHKFFGHYGIHYVDTQYRFRTVTFPKNINVKIPSKGYLIDIMSSNLSNYQSIGIFITLFAF
jgi:hypothetical protein